MSQNDFIFDPRGSLSFLPTPTSTLSISMGGYSQQLNPYNYYYAIANTGEEYVVRDRYGFIRSRRASLDYSFSKNGLKVEAGLFSYQFPEVNFSGAVDQKTDATTIGGSVVVSKDFNTNWYLLGGITVFDSKIMSFSINNPFNSKSSINVSGGKEFVKVKKGTNRVFAINGRATWQGGVYYNSATSGRTESPVVNFEDRLVGYLRFDLRAQWTKSKERTTRIWAIDLQNVANRENEAFVYYDDFIGDFQTSTQLGLIPVLTYRLEF
jgi:hypothetical protein